MIKFIVEILILLVVQPKKAWELIVERNESRDEYLAQFFYPLIGLCTLASFVGAFFHKGTNCLENALKESTITITSLFAGYFVAAFAIRQFSNKWIKVEGDIKLFQKLTAYSMALTVVISAILEVMPDFFFLRIAELYVYLIVWESIGTIVQIDEKKRVIFTSVATTIFLLSPYIIERVLYMMMPGIRAN